jgi:Putative metallopeptidase
LAAAGETSAPRITRSREYREDHPRGSTVITDRAAFRSHATGVFTAAALTFSAPAIAQVAPAHSRIAAGIDEAVKALDDLPRFKKMKPETKRQLIEFVTGKLLFVIAHEFGHGVIIEMNMPVLGREEDAADSFAIVTALNMQTTYSERVLMQAAKGHVLSAKRNEKHGVALAFYGEHGLDLQRAYNVVCLMFGSDPERFKALAADTNLPARRQASCPVEWKNMAWSWDVMLKPHLRPADKPKTAITVEFQDEQKFPVQARILRHMGLFDAFATHAADRYAWPNPITIVARSCGHPDARWKTRTLTLCYEFTDAFIDLFQTYASKLPQTLRVTR